MDKVKLKKSINRKINLNTVRRNSFNVSKTPTRGKKHSAIEEYLLRIFF